MSDQLITLEQFIDDTINELELLDSYSKVNLSYISHALLNTNSVSEAFFTKEIELSDFGKQVQLSELPTVPSIPFKENGYNIKFEVVPKGKRKPIKINRYFLVDEVK